MIEDAKNSGMLQDADYKLQYLSKMKIAFLKLLKSDIRMSLFKM